MMNGRDTPALPQAIPHRRSYVPPSAALSIPMTSHNASAPMSPVTQQGSFNYDRIIKSGEVLKRTRKTKSWKPVFLVLRPNLLSIYKDSGESKLRHQVNLWDLTAIARQRDPKRKDKSVFGIFSPSRNYHLEAGSEKEAQDWVEMIRQEAGMDKAQEEEMQLASFGGETAAFDGFGRSTEEQNNQVVTDRGGYSSSDAEILNNISMSLPKQRRHIGQGMRQASHAEYSGADHGSVSDLSDTAIAAHMSALSLPYQDPRVSTSSMQPQQPQQPTRPGVGMRSASQMSVTGLSSDAMSRASAPANSLDEDRIACQGFIHLLKSKSGVRQWKKVWMVLRPKALVMYKNEEEYAALLVLPFRTIIDVVEIDPISKSKTACMQIITDERNYRFCAFDEESLARWLGAFKSLLAKRRAKQSAAPATAPPPQIIAPS